MAKLTINAVARTCWGSRRRKVWDAEGTADGVKYYVIGAITKAEAIAQARAQVAFIKANSPALEANGYTLKASHVDTFALVFPHGGATIFGASSMLEALDSLARSYNDHDTVPAFIVAAREQLVSYHTDKNPEIP
jgi:hypothetical protein